MATRAELRKLAELRLKEAEALFAAACYDGCAYLCGYVVESVLKAAICATRGVNEYPESQLRGALRTHDFDDLRLLAGMKRSFTSNQTLLSNWSVAASGSPSADMSPRERTIRMPRRRFWMPCGVAQMEF